MRIGRRLFFFPFTTAARHKEDKMATQNKQAKRASTGDATTPGGGKNSHGSQGQLGMYAVPPNPLDAFPWPGRY